MSSRRVLAAAALMVGLAMVAAPGRAQDIQERTIRWGHLNNPDHPVSMGVKKFAEIVAAKSGGKIKVREYPSNQLGSEMQQQSALRGGTQEMQSPANDLAGRDRQGFRAGRLPLHRQYARAGGCAPGWAARHRAPSQTARKGPGRAWLLGPWVPERH